MGKFVYKNVLYNGEVTLMFDTGKHKYTWVEKNKLITSVTTAQGIINKPALVWWSANMAIDYVSEEIKPGVEYDEIELMNIFEFGRKAHNLRKDASAGLGTLFHKWVEDFINGKSPSLPKNVTVKKMIKTFLKWVKENGAEFHLAEQVTFSRKYEYAGTIDFIGTIKGKRYIGDFKTTSGIYETMLMQTAAYRFARQEEFPEEKYDGQLIIRISPDSPEMIDIAIVTGEENYKICLNAFLGALHLSRKMEEVKAYKPRKELL